MLKVSQFQAEKKFKAIDSLKQYILNTPFSNLSNTDLYVLSHDIMYRPYNWNRSTLNELKNSGGLSYITNDSLLNKGDNMITLVLDLNSIYFPELSDKDSDKPFKDIYSTDEYKISKTNDLKLISYDKALIQQFTNKYILIQDNYDVRAFSEMPRIMNYAQELIELLKNEYKL